MLRYSELIDLFGTARLAATLNVQPGHIRTMKARGSIPPEYWGELIAAAPGVVPKRYLSQITFKNLRAMRSATIGGVGSRANKSSRAKRQRVRQ